MTTVQPSIRNGKSKEYGRDRDKGMPVLKESKKEC
jgi:hypothetical protein